MENADVSEFNVMKDEKGDVIQENGYVFLRHILTQEVAKAKFEDVAAYFNLSAVTVEEVDMRYQAKETIVDVASPGPSRTVLSWSEEHTKMLLSMYIENIDSIGPLKKLKNKKQLWEEISQHLTEKTGVNYTPLQVENRYKNVSKKNKLQIKHNRTSGNSLKTTPYDTHMSQISALDDSIEPEILLTPTTIIRKANAKESSVPIETLEATTSSSEMLPPQLIEISTSSSSPLTINTAPTKKQRRNSGKIDIQSQLLEIYKKACEEKQLHRERSEAKREERHRRSEEEKRERHRQRMAMMEVFVKAINNLSENKTNEESNPKSHLE